GACPLYCGRVIRGVRLDAATPDWMSRRLERSGLRSINPVVDVTNYVMLELGQPLHAFDLARLSGSVQVRFAAPGERLALLNGQIVSLDHDMLVIADDSGPLALAGIMGGAPSAVAPGTADLFLESAFFDPAVVAGRGRRLGFGTDSSHRFERGVDFGATRHALERATALIIGVCGGRAGPLTEVKGALPARDPIALRLERARRILGIPVDEAEVQMILRRLQFSFAVEKGVFHVAPHSYRFDLAIEEDLIEELARIYGYDRIPARPPLAPAVMIPEPEAERPVDRLRRILVARDYQEVINYAFVDEQWEADFAGRKDPVRLQNPIASQLSVMRSTLIGGLVGRLQHNLSHRQPRVRLFETGACFTRTQAGYAQGERLGGLCFGEALPEQWGSRPSRLLDFFDVKGDLEALFWPRQARFEPEPHPALHPGKSATIRLDGAVAGFIGEIHPRLQQKYEIPSPVVVFELAMEALTKRDVPSYSTVSRFPPVRRDISVVVDDKVAVQTLLDALWAARPPAIVELELFDQYRGKGVDQGKKSLAFRVLLQDTQKTLTDTEVDAAITQLVQVLQSKFGARLRF
ncbi:MAG TPA: phenylalanine--tRNA ligase subunit beta, partial [Burkholderiales bacterium]